MGTKEMKVDEDMLKMARNLVTVRSEFEDRAKEYYQQTMKLRKEAQKHLKKLEKEYFK